MWQIERKNVARGEKSWLGLPKGRVMSENWILDARENEKSGDERWIGRGSDFLSS